MVHDKPWSSIRVVSSFNPWRAPVHRWCCQQHLTCQKYTTRRTWFGIWWAAGLRDGSRGLWTPCHVAMPLLNPASKPTSIFASISLYLFSLATAINQMALKQPFKQIHAQMLLHNTAAVCKKPRPIITPSSFRVCYDSFFPSIHQWRGWWVSLITYSTGRYFALSWLSNKTLKMHQPWAACCQRIIQVSAVLNLTGGTGAEGASVTHMWGRSLWLLHWSTKAYTCCMECGWFFRPAGESLSQR